MERTVTAAALVLAALFAACTREVVREIQVTSSPSATETAMPQATETPPTATSTATPTPEVSTPTPAPSPASAYAVGGTVEVNTRERVPLALLKSSSPGAPVLRNVYNGTLLRLVDGPKENDGLTWWGVEGGGWVHEGKIQEPGSGAVPPRFAAGDRAEVNTRSPDRLIVRQQATRESPEIRRVSNGEILVIGSGPIEGTETVWWGLQDGGWVSQDYIQPPGFAPVPESYQPVATPTALPPAQDFPTGELVVVVAKPCLNLRDEPSTSARKIYCMPELTLVRVIAGPVAADGYDWYLVTDGFWDGWAAGQFLR